MSGWTEPVIIYKRKPRSSDSDLPKAHGKLATKEPGYRFFLSGPLSSVQSGRANGCEECQCLPHHELGVNNTGMETKIKVKPTKMRGLGLWNSPTPLNDVNENLLAI